MKTHNVSRTIESEAFPLHPGIVLVYARWTDSKSKKEYRYTIMSEERYDKLRPKSLEDFTRNALTKERSYKVSIPKYTKKSEFKLRYYLLNKKTLEEYKKTGHIGWEGFWDSKEWLETPSLKGYELVLFCDYDHFLADVNNKPIIALQITYLCSENGWDIDALRKQKHINFVDQGYCPGNGYTCAVGYMPKSQKEMIEFVSGFRERLVIEKLGIQKFRHQDY